MEAFLKDWVRELVVLLVLAGLLEWFLPSGKAKPFVKLTMGVFVVLAVLNPLLALIKQPIDIQAELTQAAAGGPSYGDVLAEAERFRQRQDGLLVQEFRERVRLEAERLAEEIPGVKQAVAQVEAEAGGDGVPVLKRVRLSLQLGGGTRVEPVERVQVTAKGPGQAQTGPVDSPVARQVRSSVAEGLGLAEEQVLVGTGQR